MVLLMLKEWVVSENGSYPENVLYADVNRRTIEIP